jgi:hypothetical protein
MREQDRIAEAVATTVRADVGDHTAPTPVGGTNGSGDAPEVVPAG